MSDVKEPDGLACRTNEIHIFLFSEQWYVLPVGHYYRVRKSIDFLYAHHRSNILKLTTSTRIDFLP